MQSILAFVALPWSTKILYGLISDNLPIMGSRRKSYLLIGALLQFLTMIALSINSTSNLNFAIGCLFISNLSVAFSDVIVDSLMVIQSRKYPEKGADELNSFSWTCYSMGGLSGALLAAILTERYEPKYCFFYSSLMGFVMAAVATRLNV